MPVFLGTGHNSTAKAVELAARAAALGADGILVVTPYYNKPQPAGIEAHFRAIAAAVPGVPIIVYNVPGRTGSNLLPKDLARLWPIPGVVAVKESSGNLAQIGEILRAMPEGKLLFSGDDNLAMPTIAMGGDGIISVIGNILPVETRALVDASLAGRRDEARKLHARLLPLIDALFLESNPAPLKAALGLAGWCADAVRLPLAPASEATRARLAELLPDSGSRRSRRRHDGLRFAGLVLEADRGDPRRSRAAFGAGELLTHSNPERSDRPRAPPKASGRRTLG